MAAVKQPRLVCAACGRPFAGWVRTGPRSSASSCAGCIAAYDAEVAARARRWAAAVVAAHDAQGAAHVPAQLEVDDAAHELLVLLGPCPYCDEGTCSAPAAVVDTAPL